MTLNPATHPHNTDCFVYGPSLLSERTCRWCKCESPAQSRFQIQDLGGLPLVLMPVDYCLRKMVEAECAEAQIKPQVVIEMTSPDGILQAVAEGVGLTILPELYVRLRLAGSWLRMIDLYDPVPRHSVRLAYRGNRYQSIAAREFGTLRRTTMTRLLARSKHSHLSTVTTGYEQGN